MPQPLTLQEKLRRQQQSPKVGPGPWTIIPPNGNGTFGGMPTWLLLGGAGVLAWFVWKRK